MGYREVGRYGMGVSIEVDCTLTLREVAVRLATPSHRLFFGLQCLLKLTNVLHYHQAWGIWLLLSVLPEPAVVIEFGPRCRVQVGDVRLVTSAGKNISFVITSGNTQRRLRLWLAFLLQMRALVVWQPGSGVMYTCVLVNSDWDRCISYDVCRCFGSGLSQSWSGRLLHWSLQHPYWERWCLEYILFVAQLCIVIRFSFLVCKLSTLTLPRCSVLICNQTGPLLGSPGGPCQPWTTYSFNHFIVHLRKGHTYCRRLFLVFRICPRCNHGRQYISFTRFHFDD